MGLTCLQLYVLEKYKRRHNSELNKNRAWQNGSEFWKLPGDE